MSYDTLTHHLIACREPLDTQQPHPRNRLLASNLIKHSTLPTCLALLCMLRLQKLTFSCRFEEELVVQTQLEFRHSREEGLHLEGSNDLIGIEIGSPHTKTQTPFIHDLYDSFACFMTISYDWTTLDYCFVNLYNRYFPSISFLHRFERHHKSRCSYN
jgi:hypothetical protein